MAKLSERLKQAMEQRGMTASDLSRKTGISNSSLHDYLVGTNEPKRDKIYKISRALSINEAWLMGYEDASFTREDTINELYEQLSDANKEMILDFAKMLLSKQQ